MNVQCDGGVVRAVGEVDASTCGQLDERLRALDGAEPASVDLSAVTFMDSSGLRVLIEHHYLRAERGYSLTVVNPSRPVRRLLEITGLDVVMNVASE